MSPLMFKPLLLSTLIALTLTGCGGESHSEPQQNNIIDNANTNDDADNEESDTDTDTDTEDDIGKGNEDDTDTVIDTDNETVTDTDDDADSENADDSASSNVKQHDLIIRDTKQWLGQGLELIHSEFDLDRLELTIYENDQPITAVKPGHFVLSHGIIEVDLVARRFIYIPMSDANQGGFSYRLTDGRKQKQGSITIEGPFQSDPLSDEQWHLHNRGQSAFAMQPETYQALQELYMAMGWPQWQAKAQFQFNPQILVPGQDINVLGAYKHNITGQGSIVVVVDSGLAIEHEDLVNNVLPNRSLNFIDNSNDPTLAGLGGDHGTSVAGLIAAQGWNERGGRGVAPNAQLIGMNYLEQQTDRSRAASYGLTGSGISAQENIVAFNRSYGTSFPGFIATTALDEMIYRHPTTRLRNGKGALNIKSAGNSFITLDAQEAVTLCDKAQAGIVNQQRRVLSCSDSNWDGENASFYSVTIGAVNSDGTKSSYSTTGSGLWVSAPAGEAGTTEPAMLTTDQMSCQRGYSSHAAAQAFEASNGKLLAILGVENFYPRLQPFNAPGTKLNQKHNPNCHYTNTFNGTSSAAPNVSGVVALIAEANPELTWREIKHILARTADKVDPNDKPIALHVGGPMPTFSAHLGWVENAAGYAFNNKYGFGRVNAGKAVELAKSDSVTLPDLQITPWIEFTPRVPKSIPDADAQGIEFSFHINPSVVADPLVIEGLQFGFNITNRDLFRVHSKLQSGTTAASDIAIKVTSPSGTESILATSRTSLGAVDGVATTAGAGYAYHISSPILANAFYGESIYGQWTVTIADTNRASFGQFQNNRQASQLAKAQMRIFGHVPSER